MKKIIALLLAIAMVAAFAGCAKEDKPAETTAAATTEAAETTETATAPQEAEGEVMTHAEYIAAPENSPVCIETYVQAHQDWRENKVSVYAQSEDGAYFLYRMECSEEQAAKLIPGTKIRVMGFKGIHHGEIEVAEEGTFEILEGSYVAPAQHKGKHDLPDRPQHPQHRVHLPQDHHQQRRKDDELPGLFDGKFI